MMWPTQWYNFCTMFSLEVGAIGVLLFLHALLVLSALPYFPAWHNETLFTSPLCHGLTVDSRVPHSGLCTTPACFTDPDLRFSGSATTPLLPPAGSYSNPNHHIHHNCFYDSSPLPLSLFHVGFTTPICYTRHEILSVAGIASQTLPCLIMCLQELGIARNVPRRLRRS